MSFREAWTSKVEADFVVKPLYVLGREALLKNKRASGRDKDLLDVALLERAPAPRAKRKKRGTRDAKRRPPSPT